MNRAKINLILDAVLLLCMGAIGGIGFLLKYVLVPGEQRWAIYGRNVDLQFWGMDRHEWGAIHFVIGCVLLGLLVFHIVLHWRMIVGIYRALIPNTIVRRVVAVVLVVLTIFLVIFPALAKPEVLERGRAGRARGRGRQESPSPPARQDR